MIGSTIPPITMSEIHTTMTKNAKLTKLLFSTSTSLASPPTNAMTIAKTPIGAKRIMNVVIRMMTSWNDTKILLMVFCLSSCTLVTNAPNISEKKMIGRMFPDVNASKILLGIISTALSIKDVDSACSAEATICSSSIYASCVP